MKKLLTLILLLIASTAWGFDIEQSGSGTASPTFTGITTFPAGSVAAPSIVSDDADSGFYFGSKGLNWAVDGVKKFGVDSSGNMTTGGDILSNNDITCNRVFPISAATLTLQLKNFSVADNMIEMATGATTFTGFDGEIAGVVVMPTVGVLDDGDTMTLLKLAPQGTPASTLGIVRGLAFGNWGGTGTDKAFMIDATATGYDADLVRSNTTATCASDVCADVLGAYAIYLTSSESDATPDVLTIADGVAGQEKLVVLKTTSGTDDIDVTPTNFANGTKITLDTAGESVLLHFDGTKWNVVATYGGVVS